MKQKGAGNGEPTAYDYLKKLETERAAHEDERLLYVAATRAIRRLHLLGVAVADEKKDDGLKPPANGTLLKLLWPGVAQSVFVGALAGLEAVKASGSAIDSATFVPPLVRLRETGVAEALREIPGATRPADNPVDLDTAEGGLALDASVGTLVHRCLELIANNGLESWPLERIRPLETAYRRWLVQAGHSAADAAEGAATVVSALCQTLASAAGRWVLAQQNEAAAEQAWSSRDGEAVAVNHVIDRVFVADGCRWIVDYKTVRAPAADQEAFLAARAAEYRPQLERYASLFAADERPLRLAIFFPLQGVLVELP
jgi:ATP-dependent exoDNAse (exonuclease V) beta subunit